jgi:predicted O-methyltransferase YrrM
MFFFRVKTYLNYLILSGHRKGHGIHSPFVYDIVSRVFRNKTDIGIVNSIEKVRRRLIADTRIINVNDLGAGSLIGKNKNRSRKVSDIARYSSVSGKYGELLSNMAVEFGAPSVLELGTSFGISTLYMAMACPDLMIHTIEGCPEIAKIAAENFERSGIRNIKQYIGSFDDQVPPLLDSTLTPGLIFIDGDHRKAHLLKYFGMIAEKSDSHTILIIDDICLSAEMKEAWNIIKTHEKVSVTIDLYRMGIIFFREGINRNHFLVRY